MSRRRVVVTGLGAITPIGNSVDELWSNVLSGKSGVAPIESFDTTGHRVHIGAEIKDFDASKYLEERDQVVVLTGPNMGGKSTYLRQTALIVLMAQAGSFVPAREAVLPIIDRIFARIGAADNLARGQSTFMVEMQETARILHQATSRSLVLLDEIGRGTATYDGLSIAWAVTEHLATNPAARPKTLFATHYHELTDLADLHEGIVNYHVAAREWQDEIVFLRRVEPGPRTAATAFRSRGSPDCPPRS